MRPLGRILLNAVTLLSLLLLSTTAVLWVRSVAEEGRIDPQAQGEFAKRWAPWKQYVKITPSPVVPGAK